MPSYAVRPTPTAQKDYSTKAQNVFIKLLIGGLIGFLLLLIVAIGGYRFYQKWQANRLVKRAETYLSWGDTKSSALAGRRAVQLDASNADACRVLAQTAERDNQPAAIEWRQQVVSLRPESVPDQIALAKTALQFNRIDIAEAALGKLDASAEQMAPYHEVEGQMAVAKKDPAAAEKHFAEAVRLDPDRKQNRLNLAVFQLQSPARETRDQASAVLQQFMNDRELRVPAARAMRDYAAQRKDGPALLGITELLYGYPEATFRDRISYLQVLQALGHADFAAKLTEVQNEAVKDSSKLITLLSWMNNSHLAVLAIDWSKQWPPEIAKY
jgi:tetratricopeptide (TPR) repeat protein